jgi:hypothetical protein
MATLYGAWLIWVGLLMLVGVAHLVKHLYVDDRRAARNFGRRQVAQWPAVDPDLKQPHDVSVSPTGDIVRCRRTVVLGESVPGTTVGPKHRLMS